MNEVSLETKTEHLMQAIAFAKTKGVTAVKVELEASLGRFRGSSCDCDACQTYEDDTGSDSWDDARALGFILDRLGIHFDDPDDELARGEHGRCYLYDKARNPWLQYIEFYNDGSVDSEVTFTVRLDDPMAVMHVLEVVEAFKEMADHIGHGITVDGAGMHTAWLFTTDCSYPVSNSGMRLTWRTSHIANFRRAMGYMMPALFFLAAPANGKNWTRLMHFRQPGVSVYSNKYTAIHINGGAMEFRVFDTCYDCPEQMIDNLIVMSKSLKYLTGRYNGPRDAIDAYSFGNDGDRSLERLYMEEQPMELLYKHVGSLKPDYYTMTDLKKQRGFTLTKKSIGERSKLAKEKAELAWQEYAERWDMTWPMVEEEIKETATRRLLESIPHSVLQTMSSKRIDELREVTIKEEIERRLASKLNKRRFVNDIVRRQLSSFASQYTIRVSN